jgi:chromate reductase
MQLLGISGSLRRDSHNRRLLLEAAALLLPGTDFRICEGLKGLPPYDQDDDLDGGPEPVLRLRRAVAGADAVLIATPEYNSSIPGQLKNAIDWLSRPAGAGVLLGKPAAVIGASTGAFGAVWGQADARKALARAGARVVEGEVAVPYADRRLADRGRLVDDDLRPALTGLLDSLVAEVRPIAAAAA